MPDQRSQRSVSDLVALARAGDSSAWDELVALYSGRVRSVARSYRLGAADVDDVFQVTWLRLVSNLHRIHNPEGVGAWLATTASRECLRILRRSGRPARREDNWEEEQVAADPEVDTALLTTERDQGLWEAMGMLSAPCQRLLRLLAGDPPPSYEEVAVVLEMPVGSIGPTRQRCLKRLRDQFVRITGRAEGSHP